MNVSKGPLSYENWKAALDKRTASITYEYPLFTDSHIVGEIHEGYGPYKFLNTVPYDTNKTTPSLILRYPDHLPKDDVKSLAFEKTDAENYHAGEPQEEIAALLSLHLGIRFKVGKMTRLFRTDGDPMGDPLNCFFGDDPVVAYSNRDKVLPLCIGSRCVNDAILLKEFVQLKPDDAIALVKVARLYQDALWIAEAWPEQAWLLFISSIETAAFHWRKKKESSVERLKSLKPELVKKLEERGGTELVTMIAREFSVVLGSTKKFTDFLIEYLPPPPEKRPPECAQHSWNVDCMKESLRKIYEWRSKALHGGVAFPLPMCMPPMMAEYYYEEKPIGSATTSRGSIWLNQETPMVLHTFEYLARHSLQKWWKSLVG